MLQCLQAVVPLISQEKCKSLTHSGLNGDDLLKEKSDYLKYLYYSQNNHSQASLNKKSQDNVF